MLLYDVARQMRIYADQLAAEHGTTRAQWSIVAWLDRRPGITQNELAALAELSPMTVARLIDRLEAQGLVRRCNDAQDRRVWRLQLTPAAAPLLQSITSYRAKLHKVMAQGIDAATLEAMTTGLARMKNNLGAARVAVTRAEKDD